MAFQNGRDVNLTGFRALSGLNSISVSVRLRRELSRTLKKTAKDIVTFFNDPTIQNGLSFAVRL